ncbi:MAG TPA: T9SS type A sorting domain-containing protein [Bacteroidia bacterium]|nr:T9SS type A sorting domain-containing protein [Bacteroidia bacterium]HRH09639.1 T9SS type A sorting domain-containing protein [Bacteroidia bacterium]
MKTKVPSIKRLLYLVVLVHIISSENICASGNFLKTYAGINGCSFNSLDTLHDGGYVMCGADCSQGCNFIILRVDSNGQEIWRYQNSQYNGNSYGYLDNGLFKVKETYDHGIVAVGGINVDSSYNLNALVVKLDSNGSLIWNKDFGFTNYDRFENLLLDKDSNIVLSGVAYDHNLLMKINNNGDSIWCTKAPTISNPVYFYPSQVLRIKNDYYVGGLRDSIVSNYGVLTLLKFDSLGHLLWQKNYSDTVCMYDDGSYWSLNDSLILVNSYMKQGVSFFSKLTTIDLAGNIVDTSFLSFFGKIDSDSTIINTEVNPLQPDSVWLGHYNFITGNNNRYFRFYIPSFNKGDVTNDKSGNIIFCGTQLLGSNIGFLAKASDTLSLGLGVFGKKYFLNIFPIPSNEFLNVEFDKTQSFNIGTFSYEIYDFFGNRILFNTISSASFQIDVSALKMGVYLFTIYLNGIHLNTGKIIIN